MVSSSSQVKSIGMSASNYVLPTRPTHALSFIFLTTLDQHGVCENMFGQMYDELLLFLQTQDTAVGVLKCAPESCLLC